MAMKEFWPPFSLSWLFIIILSIAAAPIACIILLWFYHYSTDVMFHFGYNSITGREPLEIAFFIGNTIVAIATPLVLVSAIRQLRIAENTSRASVYLELGKRYHDDSIRYAREKIAQIERNHKKNNIHQCLSEYGQSVMMELRDEYIDKPIQDKQSEYSKIIVMLSFLEDLGVLCSHKNYLSKDDIFGLMYRAITRSEEVLKEHIKWLRDDSGSAALYANTLNLFEDARKYENKNKVMSYNKGEYRIQKKI